MAICISIVLSGLHGYCARAMTPCSLQQLLCFIDELRGTLMDAPDHAQDQRGPSITHHRLGAGVNTGPYRVPTSLRLGEGNSRVSSCRDLQASL